MQSWPAVGSDRAQEREADTEVIQQVGAVTGKFGLVALELGPRDHVERVWQFRGGASTLRRAQ
jgi:hypothetical protein